jgi:hypothetical protein
MMMVPLWLLRLALVGAGLVAWFGTQALIARRGFPDGRIGDAVHDWTAGLHRRFVERPRAAERLLIVSSALIDLLGLFLMWQAILGPSARPFVGLLILFGMRQICQGLCALPPPDGVIWRHPGFPSLLVTYGTTNDLFFSGHTAVAVYGCLELAYWGGPVAAAAGLLIAAVEIGTVLVLRAHYTMDVFTGLVAALWVWSIAAPVTLPLDVLLGRLSAS